MYGLFVLIMVGIALTSFTRGRTEVQDSGNSLAVDAVFVDVNQRQVSLDSLRGKVVVLNFWAMWCIPCLGELPALNKLAEELKPTGKIEFMAIDVDGALARSAKYFNKNRLQLSVYAAQQGLPAVLQPHSLPMTVVLDKKGEVAVKYSGVVAFNNEKIKAGLLALSDE